jgi:HEAT repeat protein
MQVIPSDKTAFFCCVLVLLTTCALQAQTPQTPQTPADYLLKAVNDPDRANLAIAALRATDDKDLAPFFTALARCSDKDRRRIGVNVLAELLKADAAPILLERLRKDPVMDIRSEALVALLELKAISPEQLVEATQMPDEKVQCLAARALIQKGQGKITIPVFEKLASSRDLATASMARMSLLGLGRTDQLPAARNVLTEPNTPPIIVGLLLEQIGEEKVVAAVGPVREIVASTPLSPIKLQAHKALAALSTDPCKSFADAITASKDDVLSVLLLKLLADRPDSMLYVKSLTLGSGIPATLARFELARKDGGDKAEQAVLAAVDLGHPIVLEYVLDRAKEDFTARGAKADFYTPGLLRYIRSVRPNPKRMEAEHVNAAQAATLLADAGTPAAMDGLKNILSGRYDAIVRSAAAGLLKTKNRSACELARPLLKSPYNELVVDAGLTLGHFGDPGASEYLSHVLARPKDHRAELVTLASWYLLKIAGQTKQTAEALAAAVR